MRAWASDRLYRYVQVIVFVTGSIVIKGVTQLELAMHAAYGVFECLDCYDVFASASSRNIKWYILREVNYDDGTFILPKMYAIRAEACAYSRPGGSPLPSDW